MRRYLPTISILALAFCAAVISPSCSWVGGLIDRVKGEGGRAHRHGDRTLMVTTTEVGEGREETGRSED